jgi:PAS domain S-box-containing protein
VSSKKSTESVSSLSDEVKRLTRELASHKIELEQARGYLQCILKSSADMIFGTDVGGILISFSKGGEKVLGYSWEDVIGKSISDFAEDPAQFERIMAATLEESGVVALDVHFRHKEQKRVHCHASFMNLKNRTGQRVGIVGVCRDITLWKKFQDDLIRVDRLAEIGRIAAGVAHEINNPLAIIGEASGWGAAVVSDAKGLDPEDRKELEAAFREIGLQTKRGRNITHKLLDFSRDSAPTRSKFDIQELLKDTIGFLGPELKHTSIEIDLRFSAQPIRISSDPRLLEQVFVNFITNAIHAIVEKGEEQGRIEITTRKTDSDSKVDITFKDNGAGIRKEDQPRIFDLFYTTKPPGKGTGLGLPICQSIVKNLGGEIFFESETGVGTSFTVRLPVSETLSY